MLTGAVALATARSPIILALDGVQDPHNLGACLRTADACGALAVVVPKDRAAQMNPTVRKVATGAAETTPVVAVTNLVRTLTMHLSTDSRCNSEAAVASTMPSWPIGFASSLNVPSGP